jgi:hypothetical protein
MTPRWRKIIGLRKPLAEMTDAELHEEILQNRKKRKSAALGQCILAPAFFIFGWVVKIKLFITAEEITDGTVKHADVPTIWLFMFLALVLLPLSQAIDALRRKPEEEIINRLFLHSQKQREATHLASSSSDGKK